MSRKILYKGTFNFEGERHILYCRASSDAHAFSMLCVQLARKLNMSSWSVRQYFWATNKYAIELINKSETSKNDTSGRREDANSQG